jgi:hypothetical protein
MLITDDSENVPTAIRSYLLDLKPGYENDPTRAVYNHVWVIGDESAISVDLQSQLDDLAEAVQIGSGTRGAPPKEKEPTGKAAQKSPSKAPKASKADQKSQPTKSSDKLKQQ